MNEHQFIDILTPTLLYGFDFNSFFLFTQYSDDVLSHLSLKGLKTVIPIPLVHNSSKQVYKEECNERRSKSRQIMNMSSKILMFCLV